MPEQVVIEFVANADQLQPAVDTIDHLTGAGTKLNTEFKNTTKVFGDTTKASQVAHLSIDQLSASVRDLNKNVIGNDAQNKVKELGTQFASSANEGKKLTTELRELKDQLSRLAQSGQAGTAEFAKLQAEAAKVQNQVNNTNKAIQILSTNGGAIRALTSVVTGLAGAFAVAQGATALFGDKNKDLEKTLVKVQGALAILNGLTAIQATLEEKSTIQTALYGGALKAVEAISKVTGLSMQASWALATGGVTLLIAGVAALIDYFQALNQEAEFQLQLQKDLKEQAIVNDKFYSSLRVVALEKELEIAKARKASLQEIQALENLVLDERIKDAKDLAENTIDADGSAFLNYQKLLAEREVLEATHVQQRIDAEKKLAEEQKKIAEDLAEAQKKAEEKRLEFLQFLLQQAADEEVAAWKARNVSLDDLYKKDADNFVNSIQKKLNAQTAALNKGFTDEDKARADNLAAAEQYTQALGQLGSTLFDYSTTLIQNEIDALEDKHRRGLISEKSYNKAIAEMRRKQALAEKEKAAFNIGIDTAKGIMSALGSDPPNVPLAVIIAATGASELAVVLSKKLPEVPKFAAGTESVKGGVRGKDSVPAILMPGERVVPTAINEKLRGIPNAELPKLLDLYPETPYISDATLDSIERGRSNHTGIDYDRLGQSVAKYIAKHPRLSVNIDENGFEKRIFEEGNKRKSLDKSYSWSG